MNTNIMIKKDFYSMMPTGVKFLYKEAMKLIAEKSHLGVAVGVLKDRGVYTFNLMDAYGLNFYKIAFIRGLEDNSKIIEENEVALYPYASKSKEDMLSTGNAIRNCVERVSLENNKNKHL